MVNMKKNAVFGAPTTVKKNNKFVNNRILASKSLTSKKAKKSTNDTPTTTGTTTNHPTAGETLRRLGKDDFGGPSLEDIGNVKRRPLLHDSSDKEDHSKKNKDSDKERQLRSSDERRLKRGRRDWNAPTSADLNRSAQEKELPGRNLIDSVIPINKLYSIF